MNTPRSLKVILLLSVLLLLPSSTERAQSNKPTCDPASVIAQAKSLKSSKDKTKDMASLLAFAKQIDAANIACNGLKFSGNVAKLLGPFDLAQGSWRVTLTTNGYFIGDLKVLSGACTNDTFPLMFDLFQGQANSGAEALIQSDGCRATIATSNITAPWTITIEPIE
jgi:hypothetical protein